MTAPAARPGAGRPLRSIDAQYRGKRYRIEESLREQGASVRPARDYTPCVGCFKTLRAHTNRLVCREGMHCLDCAIKIGLLVRPPEGVAADAAELAVREGIAWA